MKKYVPLALTAALFLLLVAFSPEAAAGARAGLCLCANTLVPSLFPFFVLSRLLGSLGMTELLTAAAGPLMQKLFRVSGAGAEAFLIGISGGYPLGAAVVARLRAEGRLERGEAERLLAFCNNSGPAFIVGAAGSVFGSAAAGLLLYAAHVLAALCTGLLFRGSRPRPAVRPAPRGPQPFSAAFPDAVAGSAAATVSVCAFVCFFSAVSALAGGFSFLPDAWRALAVGFLELGGGIGALAGSDPTPPRMALAAFLLGWGGLSVHCQTLGAVAGTDIKCARHLAGRAFCGVVSACIAYGLAYLI